MHSLTNLCVILGTFLCSCVGIFAQNANAGTEFWFAIPPNEYEGYGQSVELEFVVTAEQPGEVTLDIPFLGTSLTKPVDADEPTRFSFSEGELSFDLEVRDSEVISNKGIRIVADVPVSVQFYSERRFSEDGCTLIPVSDLGKRYRHLSYYDYYEGNPQYARGGGFVVVATEDSTDVFVAVQGSGESQTQKGTRIGDGIYVQLQEGEAYLVQGNGLDRSFDISGSSITASKPIGVVSYHMRTIIPTKVSFASRDHLCEMVPPVDQWGKTFVVRELDREDQGDYFRLLADEDNTDWSVVWYDKLTRAFIGSESGTLQSGEWFEYRETQPGFGLESVRGVSVWTTSKPCMLMQYSYSGGWDQSSSFDPFMICIAPVEQAVNKALVSVPVSEGFSANFLNIVVVGDSTDSSNEKLKSLTVNGEPVYEQTISLLASRVPNTNFYHVSVQVEGGRHEIEAETDFFGITYGITNFSNFGWPLSSKGVVLQESETELPYIHDVHYSSGIAKVTVADELVSNSASGVAFLEVDLQRSKNVFALQQRLVSKAEITEFLAVEVRPTVEDVDVELWLRAMDRSGNTMTEVLHIPYENFLSSKGVVDVDTLHILDLLIGAERTLNLRVYNEGNATYNLDSAVVSLQESAFRVDQQELVILPGDAKDLEVTFIGEFVGQAGNNGLLSLYSNDPTSPLELPLRSSLVPVLVSDIHNIGDLAEVEYYNNTEFSIPIVSGALAVTIDSIGIEDGNIVLDANLPITLQPGTTNGIRFRCNGEKLIDGFTSRGDNVEFYCSVNGTSFADALKTKVVWNPLSPSVGDQEVQPISVFPNPTSGSFTLELKSHVHSKVDIRIYSVDGKLVWYGDELVNGNNLTVVSDLDVGIYTVVVVTDGLLYSTKVEFE